jgi:hypothetical protein
MEKLAKKSSLNFRRLQARIAGNENTFTTVKCRREIFSKLKLAKKK